MSKRDREAITAASKSLVYQMFELSKEMHNDPLIDMLESIVASIDGIINAILYMDQEDISGINDELQYLKEMIGNFSKMLEQRGV